MILGKTELGQQALKERSAKLTQRQRSAFILFDGRRSVEQVLDATGGMGVTPDEITALVDEGFLIELATDKSAGQSNGLDGTANGFGGGSAQAVQPEPSTRSGQDRYRDAYPVATRLTAALGLRGFRLNLAVEGVSSYEELALLAPKIREAVGSTAYAELDRALNG